MTLKSLYQGKEYSRDKNEEKLKQTFYGTQAEVDSFIASLSIGTKDQSKGFLRSYTKTQKDGAFWQVEVEYSISHSSQWSDDDDTVVGKKSATLSARNIQMPLESHKNYLTTWNHYLISTQGYAPAWASTAKDVLIPAADRGKFQWIKSLGEVPSQPNSQGKFWEVVVKIEKPGVEYYDLSIYVVTESAAFRSASAAGNFISKKMNRIDSPSEDFNLGGEWKLDDCSVQRDGSNGKWIASNTYSRAVDEWDKDLYD